MKATFRFGSFTLDLGKHRLLGPSGEIDLRPKSFEVLTLLVERAGQVLPKAQLIEAIWPDVIVTEESLTRCISDVRRALGDDQQALIRTVPKVGYMLDVPVTTVEPARSFASRAAEKPDEKSDRGTEGKRPATALYIDIAQELERISRTDAEAALAAYERVLKCASEVLRRFGATVQASPGEGLIGLFGVPLAQEDHALRACRAAIECQQSVAGARLRIGVASGDVVFRLLAGVPDPVWTAVGRTLDQAKQLGRAAASGTTLMADDTRRLTEEQFVVSKAAIEGACRLESQVPSMTRFKAAAARGLTRFVGRDTELEQLLQAGRLVVGGRGQVVAIIGEAGVGKSRLVHELTRSLDVTYGWRVLDCASTSYGKAASYLPVVELLKRYFKIEVRDGVAGIHDKVASRLLALDARLEPALPALLALLDAPLDDAAWARLDPGQRRHRTLEALKGLLLRQARAQPLLLVVEDLHWIDAETQALLDGLVASMGAERLLLVLTYRPEYRHGWASGTHYSQLRLDALPTACTAQLLDTLLGDDPGLASLKRILVERGNPFFLEEAVRTLEDERALAGERGSYRLIRPVDTIRIPETVQAMLAARIDHLVADDRHVLEVASVIGKAVPLALLTTVAGQPEPKIQSSLDRLQSADLVDQTGLYPDVEYAFRHALIHEVAYAGLLQARLRELHAKVLEAIETLYRDRISEHTERLAYHAHRGEVPEKAVHYLRQAGLKAAGRSALADARHWLEQSLEVQDRQPQSRATMEQGFETRLELRGVLYQLGDARTLLARLSEAETIAKGLGDERRQSRVAAFMTSIHTMLGDLNEAVAIGQRALTTARGLGDLELRINTANYLVQAYYYRGDYERVLELAAESLAIWPDDWAYRYHVGNPAPASVFNRVFMAGGLAQLGRFAEAAAHEDEAIRLAEPTQNAFTIAVAHAAVPTLYALKADWKAARPRVERYIAVARTGNIIGLLSTALSASAWVLAELDQPREASSRIEEAHVLLERQAVNGIGNLSWPYCSLGRACLRLGRIDEARRMGDRASALSTSQPGLAAHALHLLADIASRADPLDADGGEALYRRALTLAEPRGMRPLVARCQAGLGNLYERRGRLVK